VKLPPGWHHGAFMEIFVRAYQDSDGDGVGDLKGLISRLGYLKRLGIKGLWLMPIQANADGDHGYATTDFRAVAPEYGTLRDFDTLLREAGRRGIGVVIDYVVNHSAAKHPMFVEARANPGSPWRDWYVFSETMPQGWDIWGKNPWYWNGPSSWAFKGEAKDVPPAPTDAKGFYFGTFGPHMPDFNMRNPEVVEYHLSSLRFWLNRGLAGYRLDAVPHLIENGATHWNDQPESRAMTRRIADMIRSYPNRYVVCEATASPQAYGDASVCGGAFAFGYVQHFVGAAKGKADSVAKLADYYRTASPTMATFVSNHDIFAGRRLWDQVDGDVVRYKLAAAGYLLQPGTPFIYYGEEVGQAGAVGAGLTGDLPIRSPMSWTPDPATGGFTRGTPFRPVAPNVTTNNVHSQRGDPQSIYHFYRAMLTLRNARPSIARGSFEHSFADGLVLGFQRRLGRERTLVLINYGEQTSRVEVPGVGRRATLRPVYPQGAVPRHGRALTLPPQSVHVYSVSVR
jgi:glycosidase